MPILIQRALGGSGNALIDNGFLCTEPGLRVLYVQKAKDNAIPHYPAYNELTINLCVSNLTNLIVLFYILESCSYISTFCPKCDVVLLGTHPIAECRANRGKKNVLNINNFDKFDEEMKGVIISFLSKNYNCNEPIELADSLRTFIEELNQDYREIFQSSILTIKNDAKIFKFGGKISWYLELINKNILITREQLLKDLLLEDGTHACDVDESMNAANVYLFHAVEQAK
ncbi:unnamed protein product [Chironomus riparius]|uniref:Uncharacterized protein n=1 Tax=Chironomus riparius TaxID=315576 RepID=A0A9N9RJV8_9DIPT|nr:unnamed protein product [Chironomus riparius]